MYDNEPVLIPDAKGKISFKKKKGSEYVQYVTGRTYDPVRKYMLPKRKIIGIRIPSMPDMSNIPMPSVVDPNGTPTSETALVINIPIGGETEPGSEQVEPETEAGIGRNLAREG